MKKYNIVRMVEYYSDNEAVMVRVQCHGNKGFVPMKEMGAQKET